MRNTTTFRVFIFSIVLLGVSLSVASYTFVSVGHSGQKLTSDLRSLKDYYYLKSEYSKLKTELAETVADREQLNSLILEGDDGAVRLLSTVDELAKDLGLTLTTKQLTKEVTKEPAFDDLFVEFGISGEARSVVKMVQMFELLPYHSQVVQLNLTRKSDTLNQNQIVDATIGLRVSIKEN